MPLPTYTPEQQARLKQLITSRPTPLAAEFIPQLIPISALPDTEAPTFEALSMGVPLPKWVVMRSTKFHLFQTYCFKIPLPVYPRRRVFCQAVRTSRTRLMADAIGLSRVDIREALSYKLHTNVYHVDELPDPTLSYAANGGITAEGKSLADPTADSIFTALDLPYWVLSIQVTPQDTSRRPRTALDPIPDGLINSALTMLNQDQAYAEIQTLSQQKLAQRAMGTPPLARTVGIEDIFLDEPTGSPAGSPAGSPIQNERN